MPQSQDELDKLISQAKETIQTLEGTGPTDGSGSGSAGQPGQDPNPNQTPGGQPVLGKYPSNEAGVQGMHDLIRHASDSQNALVESERQLATLRAQVDNRMSPANQAAERDYFAHLEQGTGVPASDLRPAVQQESRNIVREELQKMLGPSIEEAQALQEYTDQHQEFDNATHRRFLAQHSDVKDIVEQMRAKGAYGGAIQYGELRRKLSDAVDKQAAGESAAEDKQKIVNNTRGDAGIVSGSGSGASVSPNGKRPLSTERLTEIFEKAESGDYEAFNEEFINDELPSEERMLEIFNS